MGKLESQINEKLNQWVAAGLISPQEAAAIRAHESQEKQGLSWGIIIFAGFGAVVLGLGIILLFAYNWDKMHRFTKLGVVFGSMAIAHAVGLWMRRRETLRNFAESTTLLGTMLFGAGIWLVAQIYHISAHYPNGFFVWAAGALLLAWALPSIAHGLLGTALLSIWACTEATSFDSHFAVAPLLVLISTGWLAWRMRSAVLLAASLVSFTISAVAGLTSGLDEFLAVLFGCSISYAALAYLVREQVQFPDASNILRRTGTLIYFPILFLLTFNDFTAALLRENACRRYELWSLEWLVLGVFFLIVVSLAGVAIRRAYIAAQINSAAFQGGIVARSLVFVVLLAYWLPICFFKISPGIDSAADLVVAIVANLVFVYHVLFDLWSGCRNAQLKQVVCGALLLAAWVFARFTDLFESLFERGVMFVVMGVALFVVATIYHRQKNSLTVSAEKKELKI